MITFNNKQVLVAGVDEAGDMAVVHYVEALGTCANVRVEDLRATTIQELQDALTEAPILPTSEELAELDELDDLRGADDSYAERQENHARVVPGRVLTVLTTRAPSMRIQLHLDGRGCEVELDNDGEASWVGRWVGSGHGTMEHIRTLWSARRRKPQSDLVKRIIEAAKKRTADQP